MAISLTVEGETRTLKEWAADRGISYRTLLYRVSHGWTPEQVVCIKPECGTAFRLEIEWSLRECRQREAQVVLDDAYFGMYSARENGT